MIYEVDVYKPDKCRSLFCYISEPIPIPIVNILCYYFRRDRRALARTLIESILFSFSEWRFRNGTVSITEHRMRDPLMVRHPFTLTLYFCMESRYMCLAPLQMCRSGVNRTSSLPLIMIFPLCLHGSKTEIAAQ